MENIKTIVRRRYTSEQRSQFVELYRGSELTLSEFARREDLKLCTLSQWVQRAKQATRTPSVVFKEMGLPSPLLSPALEMTIGPEITLRLGAHSTPEFIAQVIRELRRPC